MKRFFFLFLLLPVIAFSQSKLYFSADGSANFDRSIQNTGYSFNVSGNAKVSSKVYLGAATGLLVVHPFVDGATVPLSARATFFTAPSLEKVSPFGIFEVGKLLHNTHATSGSTTTDMKGGVTFFTGVGMRFPSTKKLQPFFAIGYSEFKYTLNKSISAIAYHQNVDYKFRRVVVKLGVMIPHGKKKEE